MFKIAGNPTFDASLTIVGQGREQVLNVTFRHKTHAQYSELLLKLADPKKHKLDTADAVLELVEKWDADADLTRENIVALREAQPGADWAIITGFGEALTVARKGN